MGFAIVLLNVIPIHKVYVFKPTGAVENRLADGGLTAKSEYFAVHGSNHITVFTYNFVPF